MRLGLVAMLVTGVASALGCAAPDVRTCADGPHFQVIAVDLTVYKSGYAGQQKNMQYPALVDKTAIRLETCTGSAWYLSQVDEKSAGSLASHWVPIEN